MSTNPPPPLPPVPPAKGSNKTLWIVLACVGAAALFGVAILAAILIPTVGKVRETARRTVDASNLRQIASSAIIWSSEHKNQFPPVNLTSTGEPTGSTPATIQAVAAALERDGGLFEANVWFAQSDQSPGEDVYAWDFATGLNLSMPSTTPIAWTRGLRPDGTWEHDKGVYGSDGGYIAFLGGNVQFYRDLRTTPLISAKGTPTTNILETLPSTARVVGAGPGTLHGATGLAKP